MPKYTVEEIEKNGRPARFRSMGGERDVWIMPDGWGVDYAGYGQLVFRPETIDQITYHEESIR